MKYSAIALFVLAGIYLILLLCCCSRIRLGIAIMEATSKFVADVVSIFSVPLLFFLFILIWIFFWSISAVYIFSVGEVTKKAGYPVADITWN